MHNVYTSGRIAKGMFNSANVIYLSSAIFSDFTGYTKCKIDKQLDSEFYVFETFLAKTL